MSRSLRRGALAATAVVFSIASLAACGAGHDAQTLQVKPDNAAITKGDIKIQNALVITQDKKDKKDKKGSAAISATLFNSGTKDQTLDAVTLQGAKGAIVLTPASGASKVVVPAGGSVVLGGKGNASASIANGREAVEDGNVQKVVFKLSTEGDVALQAFVVPAVGMYAGFGPTDAPATGASASASPSGSPSGSPSTTPSGSPSGSPAGTPSGSPSSSAGH
ncbi:DUF461 domain-containing protein [Streptomyces sp. NBC_00454]|uniref:DUF461 domain-containing protein n=1 Tax=Streptomyces sp. NBC_00454 TaxID=2975747 RepID=UPI0030DE4575